MNRNIVFAKNLNGLLRSRELTSAEASRKSGVPRGWLWRLATKGIEFTTQSANLKKVAAFFGIKDVGLLWSEDFNPPLESDLVGLVQEIITCKKLTRLMKERGYRDDVRLILAMIDKVHEELFPTRHQ